VKVYPKSVIEDPFVAVFVDPGCANDEQLVPAEKKADASDGVIMLG